MSETKPAVEKTPAAQLTYRGKPFTVVPAEGKYNVVYEGMTIKSGAADVQSAVKSAKRFIDEYAGLPPKEKRKRDKK